MSIDAQFRKFARDIAEAAQRKVARLEGEIIDLEAQIAKKKTERDLAGLALQRLANSSIKVGIDYQCPRCWIERELRLPLAAVGGGTDTEDYFRCRSCDLHLTIRSRD